MNHKSLFSNSLYLSLFISIIHPSSFLPSLHQHYCNNWTKKEWKQKENYSFLCLINQLFTYYVCLKSWVQSKENTEPKKYEEKLFPSLFFLFLLVWTLFLLKKRFSLFFLLLNFLLYFSAVFFLLFFCFVKMWNGSLITYITLDYKQSRISAQQTFVEAMLEWSCHQGNKANKIISNYSLVYLFWIACRHWDYIWDDFLNWYHFISI